MNNMDEQNANFKLVNAAFPRLGQKLKLYWGCPEFVSLMKELQHDSSDRPRAGFPSEVLFALAKLEAEHDSAYPHLASKIPTVWSTLHS
ncbi:MAG: hypothetical protein ABI343_01005 [Burkholderiaceae bacterium]